MKITIGLDGCRSIVTFVVVPCWHWMFFITSKWCSTYSKQRDHTMTRQKMFAFKRLKTMESYKTVETKSCCKCSWEMFFMRGSYIVKGVGEIFCVFNWWSLYGRKSITRGNCRWRFDCIRNYYLMLMLLKYWHNLTLTKQKGSHYTIFSKEVEK